MKRVRKVHTARWLTSHYHPRTLCGLWHNYDGVRVGAQFKAVPVADRCAKCQRASEKLPLTAL